MPRGFTWAVYLDDLDSPWALQVDSDYVTQLERGWTSADPTGLLPFPRTWRPRRVRGIEPSGVHHMAVAASLAAPIWTGQSLTFDIRANDGTPVTCTVIDTFSERRSVPAPDAA